MPHSRAAHICTEEDSATDAWENKNKIAGLSRVVFHGGQKGARVIPPGCWGGHGLRVGEGGRVGNRF